ncbi:hypothetical protein LTR33_017833 [Friedmanniomyces endolithicus]|nr:hypothetical protein LTR33_017833 [Friedmanniomyces endolithicus]
MEDTYHDADEQVDVDVGLAEGDEKVATRRHDRLGDDAFEDLTDRQNDEFVYIY